MRLVTFANEQTAVLVNLASPKRGGPDQVSRALPETTLPTADRSGYINAYYRPFGARYSKAVQIKPASLKWEDVRAALESATAYSFPKPPPNFDSLVVDAPIPTPESDDDEKPSDFADFVAGRSKFPRASEKDRLLSMTKLGREVLAARQHEAPAPDPDFSDY